MPCPKGESNRITGLGAEIFTSGQVAYCLRVSPRTAAKMMDAGRIESYRVGIGNGHGNGDRRVTRESLLRYMRAHKVPMDRFLGGHNPVVLLVGLADMLASQIQFALPGGWETAYAASLFAAGREAAETNPAAIVFDCDALGRGPCREVAQSLAAGSGNSSVPRLIALVSLDDGGTAGEFLASGFDWCRDKGCVVDVAGLVACVTGGQGKLHANGRKQG